MSPLFVLACALAGPAIDDLLANLAEVRTRAAELKAGGDHARLAGLCEGALRVARPLVKGKRGLSRRIEVGLLLATREPTVRAQADRVHALFEEVCGLLGVAKPKAGKELPLPKELTLSDDEKALLERTNAEREKAGLKPLKANAKLFAAARGHSENMARQEKLDHTLDDKDFVARVRAEGYTMRAGGENIAEGQRTPAEAVGDWMNSEGHRANLLNGDFEEVGLAVAVTKGGRRYWTQVFASPLRR